MKLNKSLTRHMLKKLARKHAKQLERNHVVSSAKRQTYMEWLDCARNLALRGAVSSEPTPEPVEDTREES